MLKSGISHVCLGWRKGCLKEGKVARHLQSCACQKADFTWIGIIITLVHLIFPMSKAELILISNYISRRLNFRRNINLMTQASVVITNVVGVFLSTQNYVRLFTKKKKTNYVRLNYAMEHLYILHTLTMTLSNEPT